MVGAMELALGHRRSASLVIVGFSTAFQNQAEVLGRIIEALSTLRVRAVVTLGPALNITDLAAAPNVFVCRSAPHNQLLPQSPAVVTHAGHGPSSALWPPGCRLCACPSDETRTTTRHEWSRAALACG